MGFRFWQRWLLLASAGLAVFGAAFAVLNDTALFGWMDSQVNPVFWDSTSIDSAATASFKRWIYGVLGAVIMGWGIVLVFLAAGPFARRERWASSAVVVGLILWYLLDTGISLYFGVWFNAGLNTALAVLFALPLAFSRRYFR